ncbi:hypothetical protein GS597_06220 [Synechococcales cyanobacterium C]|uniref:Uncharacterized protein n=1 Tax=Petrachloros mirabilis ULC683 TaxID=2781853 RepID=A0A8K1ZXV6_9CYAN|nr:hypothetical protein [Petrachloros mirabilis]NCJ06117.1 hypothetical protein [Petrachloros mirabilis ULC683]
MSVPPNPWETPPVELDPTLVEMSAQLMAKSEPTEVVEVTEPEGLDLQTQALQELHQKLGYLLQRNGQLVAENAQLKAANQRLLDQLVQTRQAHSWQAHSWILQAWRRLTQGKPTHG